MPSVVFWAGVGGGTEWYRCRTPGAGLERLGWEVEHIDSSQATTAAYGLTEGMVEVAADIVVIQRVCHPAIVDIIRDLQAQGSTVVYDIDDWYDGVPSYNPYAAEVATQLPYVHAGLAAADLITTSTPELAEGYARFGPTRVLPNLLDPELWEGQAKYRRVHFEVHVGWLGSAAWRGADLDLLRPWLPGWLEANPSARFVVAGSDRTLLHDLGVPGLVCPADRDHVRPYTHLPAMLAWFDIGLAPLARNRFNQAKSWCKGLEYGAAGVPVVASPSREYQRYVRPGVNGELVRGGRWGDALDRVLADLPAYRRGARAVADEHVIDRHIDAWAEAYLDRAPAAA